MNEEPLRPRLAVRLGALLVANSGQLDAAEIRRHVHRAGVAKGSVRRGDGSSLGSRAGRVARRAILELEAAGVAERGERGGLRCADLADLAAWVADETEEWAERLTGPPNSATRH